jgi:hypothetical protein
VSEIAEAITYYQDEHSLVGDCDFVMANPPFNVDLVDAVVAQTPFCYNSADPNVPLSTARLWLRSR